jgi:hypothetical protein
MPNILILRMRDIMLIRFLEFFTNVLIPKQYQPLSLHCPRTAMGMLDIAPVHARYRRACTPHLIEDKRNS